MMKKVSYILSLFSLLLLFNCNKEGSKRCFEDQGVVKTEYRPLNPFTGIITWGIFDFYLKQDTSDFITVQHNENFLPLIESTIENGTLNIYDHINCKWSRQYHRGQITIHFQNINFIKTQSPSSFITLDTIFSDFLTIYARSEIAEMDLNVVCNNLTFFGSHTTSGTYFVSGKCNFIDLNTFSALVFEGTNLYTDSAYIFHNSVGDIRLNVKQKIRASIINDGNIILNDKPDIIIIENKDGFGELKYP